MTASEFKHLITRCHYKQFHGGFAILYYFLQNHLRNIWFKIRITLRFRQWLCCLDSQPKSMVHFSNKTKYKKIGSDEKRFVWRRSGEKLFFECVKNLLNSRNKYGGLGMMPAFGCGLLVRLQGIVTAKVSKQIVQQYVNPWLRSSPFQSPTFMHDNAPCHTSKKV